MNSPTPNDLTDREFIEKPEYWPRWPYLPMKRLVDGQLESGFFINISLKDNSVHFYTGNLYDTSPGAKTFVDTTVEQVFADGWTVD